MTLFCIFGVPLQPVCSAKCVILLTPPPTGQRDERVISGDEAWAYRRKLLDTDNYFFLLFTNKLTNNNENKITFCKIAPRHGCIVPGEQ